MIYPITSHNFVSTFELDDHSFAARSDVSIKFYLCANSADLISMAASFILILFGYFNIIGYKYSAESLYVLGAVGLFQTTYSIIKRARLITRSRRYEIARVDFDVITQSSDPIKRSGLFVGWLSVYTRCTAVARSPFKALSSQRCIFLMRDDEIIRGLARADQEKLSAAIDDLKKLGLNPVALSEELEFELPY